VYCTLYGLQSLIIIHFRRFGLAPKSIDMFPDARARFNKRKEYFSKMDKNGKGTITLDEWISYAFDHIKAKASTV